MDDDGFISNITIGNTIAKPKKSAFDKKKEKKLKYLEKKQFKKQNKRKNDNFSEKKKESFNKDNTKFNKKNESSFISNKIKMNEKYENKSKKDNNLNNNDNKNLTNKLKKNEDEKEDINYKNEKIKKANDNDHKEHKEDNRIKDNDKKEIRIEKSKEINEIKEENKDETEDQSNIKNELKNKNDILNEEISQKKEIKEINNININEDKIKDQNIKKENNNDSNINNKNDIKESKKNTSQTIFSIKSFSDLKINPYLKKALSKNNYTTMTKIQKKAIPILLEHKNVIVKSETGSGKTLAYIIPLYQNLIELNSIEKINRKDGIYSIIFSPTHELCLQIEKTFDKLKSCCINVVYGALMGGQKIFTEKKKIRKGLNIIISTPGRLLYHLKNSENLNFSKLKIIIIDEADLMLDMGFEKDIKECFKYIIKKNGEYENNNNYNYDNNNDIILEPELFKKFKIFLISATIDNRIRKMTNYFMKGFKAIGFEKEDDKDKDNNKNKVEDKDKEDNNDIYNINNNSNYLSNLKLQNITQYYSCIYDEYKLIHLIAFIYNNFNKKLIIFVSTCDLVEYLCKIISEITININYSSSNNISQKKTKSKKSQNLEEKNISLFTQKTYKLHGKMKHDERKTVFNEYNTDKTGILIATDVASRGLDFQEVDWIIHYDINPDIKEYVNRIGRTARIDNIGNSILFLMKNEMKLLDTCFSSIKNNLNEIKNSDILISFLNNINKNILKIKLEENINNNINNINNEEPLDENEVYRKKYTSIINLLIRCIKNFVFKDKYNLSLARKAFKSEVRAYVTFFKYGKDVFNVNMLNLTRISRSFGLYKESLSMKVGDDQVNVNYQTDRKEKYTQKKFLNKKIQNRLIYSEFE